MSRPADRCHLVMSRHTPPVLLMDGQNLVDLMAQPMNTSGVQAKSWPVPRFFHLQASYHDNNYLFS